MSAADKAPAPKIPAADQAAQTSRQPARHTASPYAPAQLPDQRPAAAVQRQAQQAINGSPQVQQAAALQRALNSSTRAGLAQRMTAPAQKKATETGPFDALKTGIENQPAHALDGGPAQELGQALRPNIHLAPEQQAAAGFGPATAPPVVQLAKTKKKKSWTQAKVEDYTQHLRRRAAKRKEKGKRKNTNKLLKRLMNAKKAANPEWVPRLADAPKAGHHVPPLALSNKLGGKFAYGKRGLGKEKERERLYFSGTEDERREQHWMMHEAEGLQGVNRSGKYSGNETDLARDMVLAHHGLERLDGTRLKAEVLTQKERQDGTTQSEEEVGVATRRIMQEQAGIELDTVESDSISSDAESDEELWLTDSDADESSDVEESMSEEY
jgi:hypothetical protein